MGGVQQKKLFATNTRQASSNIHAVSLGNLGAARGNGSYSSSDCMYVDVNMSKPIKMM